jgi:hypothetical protein
LVRLSEQVLEVQFLYLGVGCFLQNGEVIVLYCFLSALLEQSLEILRFIYGKHQLCCVTISRFNTVDTTICHILYSL